MVHQQGSYEERLRVACASGAGALARYPVLHKQMNFAELSATGVDQVLCCDLDTIFLENVDLLFERYRMADVTAREEVFSRRSIHGVDPTFINEDLLAQMAMAMGRTFVAPFNLGMILYSRRAVDRLAGAMHTFVDDAWRVLCGLALSEYPNTGAADASTFPWMEVARKSLRERDRQRALPHPSNNPWIVEEVALWLTLGALPGLTTSDFSPCDVAENGEMFSRPEEGTSWLACHYYSQNLCRVVDWLKSSLHGRALDMAPLN